jgi:type IV secretory pathway protease TraF
MTSPLDTGSRWAALGVAVFALGCLDLVLEQGWGRGPAPALVNESASLPRGLYVRRPRAEPAIGAVVAVPAPVGVRRYLADLGAAPEALLIKRVAARGGDRVCRTGRRVVTPVRTVSAHERDRRGVALPVWSGCRTLASGELFLLGDTAASFDSRYFGPIDRAAVTGVYTEVVKW